jgi:hypothetical protein
MDWLYVHLEWAYMRLIALSLALSLSLFLPLYVWVTTTTTKHQAHTHAGYRPRLVFANSADCFHRS